MTLRRSNARTVVYVAGVDHAKLAPFDGPGPKFAPRLLDIRQACRGRHVTVLNLGFGTTCQMLMAGKPILAIPMQLEQFHLAQALLRIGSSVCMLSNAKGQSQRALSTLMSDGRYIASARAFAQRYADYDPHV